MSLLYINAGARQMTVKSAVTMLNILNLAIGQITIAAYN